MYVKLEGEYFFLIESGTEKILFIFKIISYAS